MHRRARAARVIEVTGDANEGKMDKKSEEANI